MSSVHRQNSMMAMLDAKPEEKGNGGEYWSDPSDNLSPVRRHLISTYLQIPDDDAMPLLVEYFGVALSFMAMGALVRSSNSSTAKKYKRLTEEERLDFRACSRFERMALESMLREAMERLRVLSLNAYQMEERVRDLVAEGLELDKERGELLRRVVDAENAVLELRALRKAEGRANERVMCVVASKEQEWLKEKRNLQKEVEKLKENMSVMTREAKFQARRCQNTNCEHCKGIDRVVRNVKGRISLRELNIRGNHGFPKREIPKVDLNLELEEDGCLVDMTERMTQTDQNQTQSQLQLEESSSTSKSTPIVPPAEPGPSGTTELIVKQQQDMESELANILKRVGMLKKQRSGSAPLAMMEDLLMDKISSSGEDKEVTDALQDECVPESHRVEDKTDVMEDSIVSEINAHEYTFESADYASDQEDYFSVGDEEESNLVEFDKAFELKDGKDNFLAPNDNHLPLNVTAGKDEKEFQSELNSPAVNDVARSAIVQSGSGQQQKSLDGDVEFAALKTSLNPEDGSHDLEELGNSRELIDSKISHIDVLHFNDAAADGKDLSPVVLMNSQDHTVDCPDPVPVVSKNLASQQSEDHQSHADCEEGSNMLKSPMRGATEHSAPADNDAVAHMHREEEATGSRSEYQETNSGVQDASQLQPEQHAHSGIKETVGTSSRRENGQVVKNSEISSKVDQFREVSGECPQRQSAPQSSRTDEIRRISRAAADVPVEKNPGISSEMDQCHEVNESKDEHEQVLEIVAEEDANEFSDALSLPFDVVGVEGYAIGDSLSLDGDSTNHEDLDHNGHNSGLDVQENVKSASAAFDGSIMENQDIPLFERNNGDDSTGELPEPDEKRVCSSEILDHNLNGSLEAQGLNEGRKGHKGNVSSMHVADEEAVFVGNGGMVADGKQVQFLEMEENCQRNMEADGC